MIVVMFGVRFGHGLLPFLQNLVEAAAASNALYRHDPELPAGGAAAMPGSLSLR